MYRVVDVYIAGSPKTFALELYMDNSKMPGIIYYNTHSLTTIAEIKHLPLFSIMALQPQSSA